jgi:hypothetical protein
MKRLLFLFSVVPILSCATVQDIERKRAAGDFIVANYDYNWKKVFNAIEFVFRHSEVFPISERYRAAVIDYAEDEKAIWVKYTYEGSMDMGIFFVPLGESETKVEFVKGAFTGAAWRTTAIRYLIDESKFYLENGEEEYRKFTHQNQLELVKPIYGE